MAAPRASQCAYSAVTRMELLGFPGLSADEETLIHSRLEALTYLPIDSTVEDAAISLRRQRRIKLPNAVIAATALTHRLQLLTLDEGLRSVMMAIMGEKTTTP